MSQSIKQVKVVISCPSDVAKEKNIILDICHTLSDNIYSKKNLNIKTIDWEKDVPHIITGEEPQKIIDRQLDKEDYDIYIGILWKRFGDPKEKGLTPTEGEFEDALKRYKETGRPIIKFFFKKESFYPENEYEALQILAIQKFKERIKSIGLYESFNTDLEFQKKLFISIPQIIEQLTFSKDSKIQFRRIKYNEVISYISRKIYPSEKYKPDEFWFIRDNDKEDITKLLKFKNRLVLIGDAGSGKTIELERIANYFSQENASFYPLVIHLNTFSDQNIVDLLPEDWSNIPENQLLIIMDGLDEIESKNKNDAIRKIEFFSERYPASTILISCRTNFYQTEKKPSSGTLNGFESYRLLDLEYEQIQLYVDSNLFSMANKFFDEINKNYLAPLLNNPFYLITLVALFKDENALPEQRAMIYEKLFLARIKLDERHFRTTIDLEKQKEAIIKNLESVALGMECLGRNYLSEDEYKQLVPELSLRDLIKHGTAWKKEDEVDTKWQFEHNNIQEYLAARILSRQPMDTIKKFIAFKPEYKKDHTILG